jgi:hypothetical protein
MFRCCLAKLALLTAAGLLAAQPVPAEEEVLSRIVIPGESQRTARRLLAADKLATEEKWTEAVDDYLRILNEAGDDLVPLNGRHSLQARWICHLKLAALPPAALRLYRSRVDSRAKKWLDQGVANHDASLLRRLVEETFCSRFTDQALDVLGDLAFERGEFDEAERWWRMIVPPASQQNRWPRLKDELFFPDPQVDTARTRAKQILARLFRHAPDGLVEEWKAFQSLHGNAEGYLAGKKGNYAAILLALAREPGSPLVIPNRGWTTFAGDPSRNCILPHALGRLTHLPQVEGPTWSVPLESSGKILDADDRLPLRKAGPTSQAARTLAFHPVIVGDQVLVADTRYVMAYELSSGRQVLRYDVAPERSNAELGINLKLPAEPDLQYTLTATSDHVYARLGAQTLSSHRGNDLESFLVCLNWPTSVNHKIERWRVRPPAADGSPAVFEGAPLVSRGRAYIAVVRLTGVQMQTSVVCFDADTGALRWQRSVCETPDFKESERRFRNDLVTLAGDQVVYASHSGAIVSLDAATGRRIWAIRYPSRGPRTADRTPSPRSLVPCLFAGGRLYAAPADYDRILCLDPVTGHQLWESTPLEVVHLLGVAKGRLIFTTTTPRRGIQALGALTGNPQGGWFQPADGSDLTSFGRGLLAADWVFWPTRRNAAAGDSQAQDCLYVLNQEDGEVYAIAENIVGNLASVNGCLVVCDTTHLSVYLPEPLLPQHQPGGD